MQVRDVMTRRLETVSADATLDTAARKMRELGIGALPVSDGEVLVGMLTDRDIVVRSTAIAADPSRSVVRAAMTPQLFTCAEDAAVWDAVHRMQALAVRRLVVLGAGGRPVGMLSLDDVAQVAPAGAAAVIERALGERVGR